MEIAKDWEAQGLSSNPLSFFVRNTDSDSSEKLKDVFFSIPLHHCFHVN